LSGTWWKKEKKETIMRKEEKKGKHKAGRSEVHEHLGWTRARAGFPDAKKEGVNNSVAPRQRK